MAVLRDRIWELRKEVQVNEYGDEKAVFHKERPMWSNVRIVFSQNEDGLQNRQGLSHREGTIITRTPFNHRFFEYQGEVFYLLVRNPQVVRQYGYKFRRVKDGDYETAVPM